MTHQPIRSSIDSALRTIDIEMRAVDALKSRVDEEFAKAVNILAAADGRVIVSGMGKS